MEFVPLNLDIHREDFLQLSIETLEWHYEQFYENYRINCYEVIGKTPLELAEDSIESYSNLNPPEGVLYLLFVDDEAAGMGAVRKIGERLGEIKRMYNRPKFRGKKLMQKMLDELLETGKNFGFKRFVLGTPEFAYVAQYIYRKAGFTETDDNPEVEIGASFRPYYIFMEKTD